MVILEVMYLLPQSKIMQKKLFHTLMSNLMVIYC